MADFPRDILYEILRHTDARTIMVAGRVCRGWHESATDPELWREIIRREGWHEYDDVSPSAFQVIATIILCLGYPAFNLNQLLYEAVENDDCPVVRKLIETKIDVNAVDQFCHTVLYYAVMKTTSSISPKYNIIQILLDAGANIPVIGHDWAAWKIAISKHCFIEILMLLKQKCIIIDSTTQWSKNALQLSIDNGRTDYVQILIDAGVDVNASDADGYTPLHIATILNRKHIVSTLINTGAKMDMQDNTGSTALHHAARLGRRNIMQMLIYAGADVNSIDQSWTTPLFYAAGKGNDKIMWMLLKAGADVYHTNMKGETVADWADQHGYHHISGILSNKRSLAGMIDAL